jgi:hypothetical protein
MQLTEVTKEEIRKFIQYIQTVPQHNNQEADLMFDLLNNTSDLATNQLNDYLTHLVLLSRISNRNPFFEIWISGLLAGIKMAEVYDSNKELEKIHG